MYNSLESASVDAVMDDKLSLNTLLIKDKIFVLKWMASLSEALLLRLKRQQIRISHQRFPTKH